MLFSTATSLSTRLALDHGTVPTATISLQAPLAPNYGRFTSAAPKALGQHTELCSELNGRLPYLSDIVPDGVFGYPAKLTFFNAILRRSLSIGFFGSGNTLNTLVVVVLRRGALLSFGAFYTQVNWLPL